MSYNLKDDSTKKLVCELSDEGLSSIKIAKETGVSERAIRYFLAKETHQDWWNGKVEITIKESSDENDALKGFRDSQAKPKILVLDIETSPILSAVWMLFKANVGLNQIKQDWYVMSWAAKWFDEDEVFYMDKRDSWNTDNDYDLCKGVWELINQADYVVSQNGIKFDMKKLNARFVIHGMKPPSSYKNIDTLIIAKETFGFTSNKLEYMTDKLCKRYKKLKHSKFAGYDLWKECLLGNMEAWNEMELYNKYDILSLEELYTILRPWYKKHPNFNLHSDSCDNVCPCGHSSFSHSGYYYTGVSKFLKLQCDNCGYEVRDRVNLFSKEKRQSLTMNLG